MVGKRTNIGMVGGDAGEVEDNGIADVVSFLIRYCHMSCMLHLMNITVCG